MNQELTTLYDRRLKLADYSSKIIVLNIFASWCAPCLDNVSDLIKIKQEYGGHGVEVIGLVAPEIETNIAFVRKFIRLQQINFPVVWDDQDFGKSLVKTVDGPHAFGLNVLPQTFIIDKDGRILKRFEGFNHSITPALMRKVVDQAAKKGKQKD